VTAVSLVMFMVHAGCNSLIILENGGPPNGPPGAEQREQAGGEIIRHFV